MSESGASNPAYSARSSISKAAVNRFLRQTKDNLKPFNWSADPDKIIAAVGRGHQALDSSH
jgi:hypothetical protein